MSMMKDMAYVMVGGLIASTLLAMFLMPAFYLLIRRENLDGTKKGRRKSSSPNLWRPEAPSPDRPQ